MSQDKKLTHVNVKGKAEMVDISHKDDHERTATAEGFIQLAPSTIQLIRDNEIKKGDVLTIAEIAGIQGGKRTSELIPLCHPLVISKLDVNAVLEEGGVRIQSFAKCIGKTGIEMEVLTAVQVALLTVYDMCKAVDKNMVIGQVQLIEKTKTNLG